MEVGTNWTILNLGIRLRQARDGQWINPATLNKHFAFGLCTGTAKPYGSAEPHHFLGVRSRSNWTRVQALNWWQVGWNIFQSARTEEWDHATGIDGTLRVSRDEDAYASAWYLRYTKKGGTITVDLFLPTGINTPTEDDFLMQMDRERWNPSVNNHDTYRQFSAEVPFDLGLGELDSVNIFGEPQNFVSNQLRGMEWLSVRAVRIE